MVVLCCLIGSPGKILIGAPRNLFTKEEDKQLIELVRTYGTNWETIASGMPDHTAEQCRNRWYECAKKEPQMVSIEKNKRKRHFAQREDVALVAFVNKYGTDADAWEIIASNMPNFNARQCRDRWLNYLRPGINRNPFSPEEDALLISLFKEYGPKWALFAKRHFLGRTDMQLKNRHNQLKHATFLISPHEGIQPKEDQSPKQSNHLEQKSVESLEDFGGGSDNDLKNSWNNHVPKLQDSRQLLHSSIFSDEFNLGSVWDEYFFKQNPVMNPYQFFEEFISGY
jgi:hypothetical protein